MSNLNPWSSAIAAVKGLTGSYALETTPKKILDDLMNYAKSSGNLKPRYMEGNGNLPSPKSANYRANAQFFIEDTATMIFWNPKSGEDFPWAITYRLNGETVELHECYSVCQFIRLLINIMVDQKVFFSC